MSIWRLILPFVVIAGSAAATTFEDTVQPILESNCLPCHGQATRSSGFSINDAESVIVGGARHGPAVRAGNPAGSVLIKALRGEVSPQMPLGKPALAEADVAAIEAWIGQLDSRTAPAPEETHWALVQPRREKPPAAQNIQWARNGIDNFTLAKLEQNGLAPAREASRRDVDPTTLLRLDWSASSLGGSRGFRSEHLPRRLRPAGGPSAGGSAARGALGSPLA